MFKSDHFDPLEVPSATTTPEANTSIDGLLQRAGLTGLVAPGESGLLENDEVTVLDLTYSRDGMKYRLQHASETVRWLVPVGAVQALPGNKTTCRFHPDTGELLVDE